MTVRLHKSPVHTSSICECDTNFDVTNSARTIRSVFNSCELFAQIAAIRLLALAFTGSKDRALWSLNCHRFISLKYEQICPATTFEILKFVKKLWRNIWIMTYGGRKVAICFFWYQNSRKTDVMRFLIWIFLLFLLFCYLKSRLTFCENVFFYFSTFLLPEKQVLFYLLTLADEKWQFAFLRFVRQHYRR